MNSALLLGRVIRSSLFTSHVISSGLAGVLLLTGCATKPTEKAGYTFFPPPPDVPRVQFLAAFSSEADLGGGSKFAEFVTGKPKVENALVKPYGITMHAGQIFVCDTMASAVQVFDFAAKRS